MSSDTTQAHNFHAEDDAGTKKDVVLNVGAEQEDGSVIVTGFEDEPSEQVEQTTQQTDDRTVTNTPAQEAEAEQQELAAAGTDAEREQIRARRRQERAERRDRRRERESEFGRHIEAQNRIIDELRGQVDALARRTVQSDAAQVDARVKQTESNISYLKTVIEDATKVGNGAAVAEATLQMTRAVREAEALNAMRQRIAGAAAQTKPPGPDPRIVANAQAWHNDHSWYDPQGRDEDSRLVLALDAQLTQEGYSPLSPTYWQELDRRVERHLPHRADGVTTRPNGGAAAGAPKQGYNAPTGKPSRSVVAGGNHSSGGAAESGTRTGFTLSADRVRALKDAGMWDDPKARKEAIQRFRDYDAAATR